MWKATFLKLHCCHFLLCCLFFLICSNLGIKTQNTRTENRTKTSSKKKRKTISAFVFVFIINLKPHDRLLLCSFQVLWHPDGNPAQRQKLVWDIRLDGELRYASQHAVCLFLWHHLCFEVTDLKQPFFFPSTTQTRDMWNQCNLIPTQTINISGEWSR